MAAAIEGMEDLVQEFLAESAEGVDALDRDVVALEREPQSRELLAEIFRGVHTLKGNSGILGYPKLESVAHAGENLLARLRDGGLVLSQEIANGLLAMVDALRGLLGAIAENGGEGEGEYASVVELLEGLSRNAGRASQADENAEAEKTPSKSATGAVPSLSSSGSNIRVTVSLLDRLVNLVGELVLARNQVLHLAAETSDLSLANAAQRLKSVTTSLEQAVMKARMQPIGSLWNRLPRLVREIAATCGKEVAIEVKGAEIELDRTILEAIRDPLTHILRNAIDHGIESAEERKAAEKAAGGHLGLSAFQRGGRVHVEISDDGAGIDPERVRQQALERDLITPAQAASMGEAELANLVFAPGFSTVETATSLSGRGVGLDVVRTNIERVGGVVDVQSVPGQGTTVKISLPLTLAILPALIVSCGGERFAIPQASLVEVVRLDPNHGPNPIEQICGVPVYRLRDRLLPLVFLNRVFQLPQQPAGVAHVLVLEAGSRQFGLVVDAVHDSEELVVKPLSRHLKGLACFAGAAILGDGSVVLIVDVIGVAQLANLTTGLRPQARKPSAGTEIASAPARQSWLTFRGAAGSRYALPMPAITRLEELPAKNVEHSHDGDVVRYRGEILRLLHLSELFHEPSLEHDLLQVLVIGEAGEKVGLVVDRIEDIVEEPVELRAAGRTNLVRGAALIKERAADVLDVEKLLAWLGRRSTQKWQAAKVMDSARRFCTFFANGMWLGVAVEDVHEVLREQPVAHVPLAQPEIAGLMNLRGQIVTVIDLRRRLGLPRRTAGQSAMNVVVSSGGGVVSLLVDEVGEVLEAAQDCYEAAPESLPVESRQMVSGVYKLPEGLLHALELSAVTALPQAREG